MMKKTKTDKEKIENIFDTKHLTHKKKIEVYVSKFYAKKGESFVI